MKLQLNTVFGDLIFEGDFASVAELVLAALAAKKSLSSADLSHADLSYANLRHADLRDANLRHADLSSADLSYADLSYANLRHADLRDANLRHANLRHANLSSADLSYANLRHAKNSELVIAMTRILPDGTITGWKKLADGIIAQIEIPATAKRSHAFGRKCRASSAKVVAMFSGAVPFEGVGRSIYTSEFTYQIGATVEPTDAFSEDWMEECASGIHFYITRAEAEAHTTRLDHVCYSCRQFLKAAVSDALKAKRPA